jgi:hypothetical protein
LTILWLQHLRPNMSDDRKSVTSYPVTVVGRVALRVCWALALAVSLFVMVPAAAASTLEVEARDALPGFLRADLPRYLALRMASAGLSDWRFQPAGGGGLAADRVEWSFKLNPYAGGEVRNFVRTLSHERKFGVHRPITIEARLYLNGEYQTLVEKQAIVQGGPDDPDLAAAVASATQNLLGPSGAYRAIDIRQRRADQPK